MRYTGPTQAVLDVVRARNGGMCLRCDRRRGEQVHHRVPRGMGGTRDKAVNLPPNLAFLCEPCHRDIESHRSHAYRNGWLVRRGADPAGVCLVTLAVAGGGHHLLVLLPDGGVERDYIPHLTDQKAPF